MRYWVLAFFVTFSGMLCAYDVEVDGIYYGLIGTRKAYVKQPGDWMTQGKAYSGDIVIPEQITYNGRTYTVTSVGEGAFAGCDSLASVQLPSTMRALSACAFLGCTNLRQVSFPATLQAVNACTFMGCTSLQQVALPRHAELVDSFSLYCCASLTSVVLPHSVRTICGGAIEHLPALTDLYCFSSIPPIAEPGAFTLADQQHCTLHVPAEALHLYQTSAHWKEFNCIVVLDDDDYLKQNYRRSDINDDGLVDVEDLLLLRQLIVNLSDNKAVRWAADVNGDGIVNSVDFVKLASELSLSKM